MKELNGLEYKADHIPAGEAAEAAAAIDAYASRVNGSVPTSVIVGSMERPDYTLPAVSWIAHMPETMLYVSEKDVPEETAQALKQRNGRRISTSSGLKRWCPRPLKTSCGSMGR